MRTKVVVAAVATTGLLGLAGAANAFAPAETSSQTLMASTEAWYAASPTCMLVTGCVRPDGAPVVDPFPAGTLHVSVNAGAENARTYLAIPTYMILSSRSEVALDIPLDLAQQDGSAAPDTATVTACLYVSTLEPVEGSMEEPPEIDCSIAVPLTYEATPAPHLTADLGPLVPTLRTASGLALVPDATKVTQSSTWSVVFSAHTRTGADATGAAFTGPASLAVTTDVVDDAVAEEPAAPVDEVPTVDDTTVDTGYVDTGGGFALGPIDVAPPPSAPDPSVAPPDATAPADAPAGAVASSDDGDDTVEESALVKHHYRYRFVWFLPVALAFLFPVAYRSLVAGTAED